MSWVYFENLNKISYESQRLNLVQNLSYVKFGKFEQSLNIDSSLQINIKLLKYI